MHALVYSSMSTLNALPHSKGMIGTHKFKMGHVTLTTRPLRSGLSSLYNWEGDNYSIFL